MRRTRAAVLALAGALVLGVAGCGGAEIEYVEVTSPPPTLPIPRDDTADSSADPDTDPDATADETPTPTATADDGAAATTGSAGGTAAPSTGTTGATTGTTGTTGATGTTGTTTAPPAETPAPDTGGATADQGLDQFCADNPGACDG